MFGKKPAGTGLTYIAQGTQLKGETQFEGDALIGGQLTGAVLAQGKITIELGGSIEGDVSCSEIKIAGHFKGKLHCEKLIITSSGMLEGEVASTSMEIFDGGQFIGSRIKETITPFNLEHYRLDLNSEQALEKAQA